MSRDILINSEGAGAAPVFQLNLYIFRIHL